MRRGSKRRAFSKCCTWRGGARDDWGDAMETKPGKTWKWWHGEDNLGFYREGNIGRRRSWRELHFRFAINFRFSWSNVCKVPATCPGDYDWKAVKNRAYLVKSATLCLKVISCSSKSSHNAPFNKKLNDSFQEDSFVRM